MKIKLKNVAETSFIPLWARGTETKKKNPIIQDFKAIELMEMIDYDFNKFNNQKSTQLGVAIRTMLFDNEVTKFVQRYPNANIINIGSGFDTRYTRIDNGKIKWFDLDLPELITLRKNFFSDTKQYKMIAKSVLDYTWINDIKNKNNPTLFIAEGIFMYFKEKDIIQLFKELQNHFPHAEILFETISEFLSKNTKMHPTMKNTNVQFKWGLNNGKKIEQLVPNTQFIENWNYYDFYIKRWKMPIRIINKIPFINKKFMSQIIHINLHK